MVFFAPNTKRTFNNLELYRVFYGFNDDVTCIDWSTDSKFFIATSSDNSSRIYSVYRLEKLIVYTLSAHRNPVIGGYFFQESLDCLTISCDGDVCIWAADTDIDKVSEDNPAKKKVLFRLKERFRNSPDSNGSQTLVSAVAFHKHLRLLSTGFESGLLTLHSMPEFTLLSEIRLFTHQINSLAFNLTGDWIGAASEPNGQLVVWEWRSEACYLKAESHARQMTSLAYSPDGLHLATGGNDAKVKVWRIAGGRAVVTFTNHTAAVTGVAFPALKSKVVISASLDGTVRAHDLVRYRNFRTFSVPTRQVQFACLAVDNMGSLVSAGSLDTFEAFVWSVKTGVLLATLTGHSAPISCLAFSPDISGYGIELASVSWDKTLRLWDLTGNSDDEHNLTSLGSMKEAVNFNHDVLSVTYRADGKELAMSLLNGDIVFYDPHESKEKGSISGKRDLGVAQTTETDLITPKRAAESKKFQSIAYSADGEHLLAAGDSKYICLYSVPDRVLLKRFEVTCNLSLDGVQEVHDRRRFLANYSSESVQSKLLEKVSLPIPSSRSGVDRSRREWRPEVSVSSIQFSPTGDAFAATTTEGVLVYSNDLAQSGFGLANHFGQSGFELGLFDAVGLDENATPNAARHAVADAQYALALDIAIRLRLNELMEEVIESIPVDQIDFLARQLPIYQVVHYMIPFLARQLSGRSRHVEFYVHWTDSILRSHSAVLRRGAASLAISQLSTSHVAGKTAEKLDLPGFLVDKGEWSMCRANLVRLQSSLERIKSNVIERFDAVDNLWNYLRTVASINQSNHSKLLMIDSLMDTLDDENVVQPRDQLSGEPLSEPRTRQLKITKKKKKKNLTKLVTQTTSA